MPPLVSVLMITYKHAPYIEQAIISILDQQTDFKFELVISDDCSPDNTSTIVREIQDKHVRGANIRYYRQEKNIGFVDNYVFCYRQCSGQYIAICEGDDFWLDNCKLQKQVIFLEENSDIVAVGHECIFLSPDGQITNMGTHPPEAYRCRSTAQELKNGFGIPNQTLMYRYVPATSLFNKGYYQVRNGDRYILSMLGKYGGAYFMPNVLPSVYRVHNNGIWNGISKLQKLIEHNILFSTLREHYSSIADVETALNYHNLLKNNRIKMIKEIAYIENFTQLRQTNWNFIMYSNSLNDFIREFTLLLKYNIKFLKRQIDQVKV